MMERLAARGRRIVEARAERRLALAASVARDELPGDMSVEKSGDGLVINGRALGARWLVDGRLRGLGALLKGAAR